MSKESRRTETPLMRDAWRYIDKRALEDLRGPDWQLLNTQKKQYLAERQASEVLRMLKMQQSDPSFGYTINMYEHCLQTATRMYRDGLSEEDIVVGLLHDIGYMVCPHRHGDYAALLLEPYVSDRNIWMLRHHEVFQQVHFHDCDDLDPDAREQWRGHAYFDWTEEFIAKYDQVTINFDEEILPIETFEPMVVRVFARATTG